MQKVIIFIAIPVIIFISVLSGPTSVSGFEIKYAQLNKINVDNVDLGGANMWGLGYRGRKNMIGLEAEAFSNTFGSGYTISFDDGSFKDEDGGIFMAQLKLLLGWPLMDEKLFPHISLGYGYWSIFGVDSGPKIADEDGNLYSYGVGLEYNVVGPIGLMVEVSFPTFNYSIGDGKHTLISVGFKFGY